MELQDGIGYQLNGLDLGQTTAAGAKFKTLGVDGFEELPGTTGRSNQNAYADGGWVDEAFVEPKTIVLRERIQSGNNRPAATEALRMFNRAVPVRSLAPLVVSMDGEVRHRLVRQEGEPSQPRPVDDYVLMDVQLSDPFSRILSGDGTGPTFAAGPVGLPRVVGGLRLLPEVRTNPSTNPGALSPGTGFATWSLGVGEAGATTYITGAVDGPVAGPTSYARRTTTTAKTSGSNGWTATSGVYRATKAGLAGQSETVSVWVRYTGAGTQAITMRAQVNNAAGTTINSGDSTPYTLASGVWARISATVVAAADYATIGWWAFQTSAQILPVGSTMDSTGVLPGDPGPYFDGSTPSGGGITFAWTAAPGASTSTATASGLRAPFRIVATVQSGEIILATNGTTTPPVLLRLNGPFVDATITTGDGQTMTYTEAVDAGQWVDIRLDGPRSYVKINGTVNRRSKLRGNWIIPADGMAFKFNSSVYNPDASMMLSAHSAWR